MAAWPERQVGDTRDRGERQRAMEMREQGAAARRFPAQGIAQARGVDLDDRQPVLAGAMPGDAGDDLRRAREMDEPVCLVLARAAIAAGPARRLELVAP